MKRRTTCFAVAAITAAIALPSVAQPARPYRVAWVSADRKNVPSANLEAFRGGLRELGYIEGRDLVIETWLGEGSSERVRQMVPAMLAWQPDLIVASSGLALFPLKAAGVKLPIVFSLSADPVEAKVVESYARPGGNVTDIARARDDAILAFADGFTMGFAGRIAEFSLKHRIPAIDGWAQFAQAGNLMTYGPVGPDVYRRLASYADRIRKGAKPGDLPVELPIKVEFVLNDKTAKALGIAIPPSVLARADDVIR